LTIPDEYKQGYVLTDGELKQENEWSADIYCDELYGVDSGEKVVFGYSRLLCDPERFRDDALEPNAAKGNGFFYTHTLRGERLRREEPGFKQKVLTDIYDKHHERLTLAVDKALENHGLCLIIDGHSFPDNTCFGDDLPDFCIGADEYHTPDLLTQTAVNTVRSHGYSVEINRPFSGSIVPMSRYGKDKRVMSLMIEVNRRLYLREGTIEKSADFNRIKDVCKTIIQTLREVI
jgi:N-formylglutamate amidohydrolase